jgi:hypothetical protein
MEKLNQFEGKKRHPDNELEATEMKNNLEQTKTKSRKNKKEKKVKKSKKATDEHEIKANQEKYESFVLHRDLKSEKFEFYYKVQLNIII